MIRANRNRKDVIPAIKYPKGAGIRPYHSLPNSHRFLKYIFFESLKFIFDNESNNDPYHYYYENILSKNMNGAIIVLNSVSRLFNKMHEKTEYDEKSSYEQKSCFTIPI